jgi:putative salt-induced outer membrane protein YdiY
VQTVIDKLVVFGTEYGLKVIGAVVILIAGRIVAGLIRKIIGKLLEKAKMDASIVSFAPNLGFFVIIVFGVYILCACAASQASADTVILKNGDRISGTGCSVKDKSVTITTGYAKEIKLDLSAVEKMTFDKSVKVILADGREKEQAELSSSDADFGQIKAVNPPPSKVWSLDAGAGFSLSQGNSDTQDVNLQLTALRFIEDSYRLTGHGEYYWGRVKNTVTDEYDKTSDRGALWLQGDLFVIKNGYLYGRSEGSFDKIKKITRRLDNGLGLGYEIYRSATAYLDAELGASYIDTKYEDDSKDHGIFLRLAEKGELALSDIVALVESVSYKPKANDFNDYLLNAEAGVKVSLTDELYLKLSVVDAYDSTPPEGTKRNDVSLISFLGVTL